ncbi:hypothetical protein AB0395_24875 [Streptosporangium sp. NPDC051023]|uniref:hypothetical protein n=1 Tax=Streptosporangium sp. NPDC051023 TaxID=3155410 RepID=UPI0034501E5E
MREVKKVLILGYGVLGGRVVDEVLRAHPGIQVFVAGRNERRLEERVNLARYAALNYGDAAEVTAVPIDLLDGERTAKAVEALRPDLVLNATSMLPWWRLDELPPRVRDGIKKAGSGIWAATDLLLPLRLTQALDRAGFDGVFVNASFADLVNPVVFNPAVGPVCGIGNVANAVPGLTLAAAAMLEEDIRDVRIRFVAHHFLSYTMPTTGTGGGAPYILQVLVREEDVSPEIDPEALFRSVATRFRRVKGVAGQAVTVSSAMSVVNALIDGRSRYAHAPGVLGRAGGYPVRIDGGSVEFDLPGTTDPTEAEAVNSTAAAWDGIRAVSRTDGIWVTDSAAAIAQEMLKYDANGISIENCEEKAVELAERFESLLRD